MSDNSIICGSHGETRATFVCRHLLEGVACGFHANPPAPDDPWPDAWCDLCEEAFQAGGGEWNEESEQSAAIRALCSYCYQDIRGRNETVPDLALGSPARLTDDEAAELVHYAVHQAQALQDISDERWGWRDMARWDFDHDASTLTFSDSTRERVIADVRLVGSYSTNSNTFQWAWQTLRQGAAESAAVSRLRVFGEVRGIRQLTTPCWQCDETTGWEMAALAAYILGAEGVYRAPFDHQLWFMLLSNWRQPH